MNRHSVMVAALAVAGLFAPSPGDSAAQGVQTGAIRGFVHDEQGLVVTGVTITITSAALQGERHARSADDGSFDISLLPPGEYDAVFEKAPLRARRYLVVPLGGVVEDAVVLRPVIEAMPVTVRPSALDMPTDGLNIRREEVEALAVARDIQGIALLSQGVTDSAPDAASGQLAINGGFGFDNLIMIDGVDINDSVTGIPQRLYVEDAIQETQTLTSGVSADYGRFTGGVVNVITRSGGNEFAGSVRLNLGNPAWSVETPPEKALGQERDATMNESWEGTFGGPIVRDRLWFFSAMRFEGLTSSEVLPVTGLAYQQHDTNRRWDVKATATLAPGHSLQGGAAADYLRERDRPSTPDALDLASLTSPYQSNWYGFATYRGIAGGVTLLESTFVERRFRFTDFGGTASTLVDSPFLVDPVFGGRYNAPFFSADDPEHRDNRQFSGSVARLFASPAGVHQIKAGYEWFRSRRQGGTMLSSTGAFFVTPYLEDEGAPVVDSDGRLVPQFVPELTSIVQMTPALGASLEVTTQSAFAQDLWTIVPKLSVSIGMRVEHVGSVEEPWTQDGIDAVAFQPRFAGSYAITGDGAHVVQASYGWYGGRAVDTQVGAAARAIHPDLVASIYLGSEGAGRDFAPGFSLDNYSPAFIQTAATSFLSPHLRLPLVREMAMSYGVSLNERGYVEGGYVHRSAAHLIEDEIDISNGLSSVLVPGTGGLEQDVVNVVWRNTNVGRRIYDALVARGRYVVSPRLTLTGHYTLQLRNDGNYEGEASGVPGAPSPILDVPEVHSAARHYPDGRLLGFQRHRIRLWTTTNIDMGSAGTLTASGLWRLESGRTYSLVAAMPYTETQHELAAAAGYPLGTLAPLQAVYFDSRGSEQFSGYGAVDTSVTYAIPVFRSLGPYLKVDVFNLFNTQDPIRFDTSIVPDPDSPLDALGLPTGYLKGPRYQTADDPRDYPAPIVGSTGGRTLRLALGVRF